MASHPKIRTEEKRYTIWKWWTLFAVMFCYLFYYLGRFNLGVCMRPIAEEFGWTTGQVGKIITIFIITYSIGQFVNGQFADRYGRIMMVVGAVLSLAANWCFSFSPEIGRTLGQFLGISGAVSLVFGTMAVIWGVNGFVQSTGMPAGGRWISNWWVREERGFAMGMYSFAACMSTITVFNLAAFSAAHWGWRAAFLYPVILMATVPIVVYLFSKDYPEQVGLKSRETDGKTTDKHRGFQHYVTALKNRHFLFACVSIACQHAVRWGLLTFLPAFFMEAAGWNIKGAGFVTSALPLGMGLGALTGGYISDKVFKGRRANTIFVSMLLCAVCAILIPYLTVGAKVLNQPSKIKSETREPGISNEQNTIKETEAAGNNTTKIAVPHSRKPIAVIMLLVSGFLLYISIGPYFALVPDLLGVEHTGTGFGIMDAFAYAGAAAGTYGMSCLVDDIGYKAIFIFMGCSALLAAILIKLVREK